MLGEESTKKKKTKNLNLKGNKVATKFPRFVKKIFQQL
jgi:ATP phosphoribosyltransferase